MEMVSFFQTNHLLCISPQVQLVHTAMYGLLNVFFMQNHQVQQKYCPNKNSKKKHILHVFGRLRSKKNMLKLNGQMVEKLTGLASRSRPASLAKNTNSSARCCHRKDDWPKATLRSRNLLLNQTWFRTKTMERLTDFRVHMEKLRSFNAQPFSHPVSNKTAPQAPFCYVLLKIMF